MGDDVEYTHGTEISRRCFLFIQLHDGMQVDWKILRLASSLINPDLFQITINELDVVMCSIWQRGSIVHTVLEQHMNRLELFASNGGLVSLLMFIISVDSEWHSKGDRIDETCDDSKGNRELYK